MKLLFSIFFVVIVIVSGCSNVIDEEKAEIKTIQQATLESNIPSEDIFYTNEMDDSAFSLFQSPNGYGILNFSNTENGWVYQGNSGFEYTIDIEKTSFTFSQSTWHKGEISLENESIYTTVFLGEIFEPKINRIIVEYDNLKEEANIVKNKDRRYWNLLSKQDNGDETLYKISAYSSDGKLLYERE
ncbi:hypothetical protein [Oceanobacillus chungangensis]|uniref:Uncharacterized protein n=1 Tax=Oceanobacillus chungangensis TaxID=1229152 RepID=A0A3D8PQK1_9BACI|nr:hypothetical protein [Oceanobacillus chungangensis]RDW17459.1 hypothetical protein CWR45_12120 [Oceanobacillus chungangensis]